MNKMQRATMIIVMGLLVIFMVWYISFLTYLHNDSSLNSPIQEIRVYTPNDETYIYNSLESGVNFKYNITSDYIYITVGNHNLSIFPKEQVKNIEVNVIGKAKDLKPPPKKS